MTAPSTDAPVVRVRDAAWRDVADLARLEAEVFGPTAWSVDQWWQELAQRPRRDYLVLTDPDDSVLAYGGLDIAHDTADVMTVAVAPAARGAGLGSRVVRELLARATEHGADTVLLEVRADNTAALSLYARHGFARVGLRRRYYQPGDVDAVVMRRRIDGTEAAGD